MKSFTYTRGLCTRFLLSLILIISLFTPATSQVRMRANLMIVDASGATLMDGNMTQYGASYSNDIDNWDIWKLSNPGENFGIIRSTANLVVERRKTIAAADTTTFRMWNIRQRGYRLQLILENLHNNNLFAYLRDTYLNQDIPVSLNDTTNVDFTVGNQPGSASATRFQLIYKNILAAGGALPVQFTGIQVQRKQGDIQVSWSVAQESNLDKYVVEHSANGTHFSTVTQVSGSNSSLAKSYSVADARSTTADHFYRIRAVDADGKTQYSAIARLAATKGVQQLNVYPNPVASHQAQLQLEVAQAGKYEVTLISLNGSRQAIGIIAVPAGQSVQSLHLPANVVPGVYRLQLASPSKSSVLMKSIHVL
ncbi:MAG: T9SS type A sorting domain-containing protein [Sphingobacteriales bacterium]|nr:MAG: T9SS type A sorting domain-containing protein [Sphingobacteriales bacterium]